MATTISYTMNPEFLHNVFEDALVEMEKQVVEALRARVEPLIQEAAKEMCKELNQKMSAHAEYSVMSQRPIITLVLKETQLTV